MKIREEDGICEEGKVIPPVLKSKVEELVPEGMT